MTEELDEILKGVSRSFYVTLRWLPSEMRVPVSLGYLLARASDTIADTEAVAVAARADLLAAYGEAVQSGELGAMQTPVNEGLVPWLQDDREARLMTELDAIEREVMRRSEQEKGLLRELLQTIVAGQLWDLTYFPQGEMRQVETDEELELYAYRVAGSVGEFWTKVGFLTQGAGYARADEPTMLARGKRYGQALQLINILRDFGRDEELGRIYLPDGDRERWSAQAREWLNEGFSYCRDLPRWRLRMPTVLPALLGEDTLNLMDRATPAQLQAGVKVSRRVVYANLWQAAVYR